MGTMSIVGTLDSTEMEAGLLRIDGQLKIVDNQAKNTNTTFTRLGKSAKGLASSMVTIGTIGVGAMTSLAAISPAVAPAMAQIGIGMRQLSFALGERLSPLFASIGNDLIPGIGTAVERLSPQIDSLVSIGVEGISDIASALSGDLSSIEGLVPKTGMAALGAAAGFALLGPKGLFIGAALGYAAEGAIVPDVTPEQQQQFGLFAETAASAEKTGNLITKTDFGGDILGAANPRHQLALYSSAFKTGTNAIFDLIEWLISKTSDKERSYTSTNKGTK